MSNKRVGSGNLYKARSAFKNNLPGGVSKPLISSGWIKAKELVN